jgi:hypothetical protein
MLRIARKILLVSQELDSRTFVVFLSWDGNRFSKADAARTIGN